MKIKHGWNEEEDNLPFPLYLIHDLYICAYTHRVYSSSGKYSADDIEFVWEMFERELNAIPPNDWITIDQKESRLR